jgi:predicted XRE-type DNA-binding protein
MKLQKSAGNVYADLGLDDADSLLVKARLAANICELISHRGLTQVQAASLLGIPQPKVSAIVNGRFRGISEAKLMECLNRLGKDVEIVVRDARRASRPGATRVVFA